MQSLRQSHDPFTNPLKNFLYIELYNEKWFNKSLYISIPHFTYEHDTFKVPTESLPIFPSVIELYEGTITCPIPATDRESR